MLKLYLDNCCYNRPFDDLTQEKINAESNAIESIFSMYGNNEVKIYKSKILDYEIDQISSGAKKRQIEDLCDLLELQDIPYTNEIENRVDELLKFNIHLMDAYHIAYSESANIDYFLTVDKLLINASKRANLKVKVINPIEFIMEVV